jgi:hypothetical protein
MAEALIKVSDKLVNGKPEIQLEVKFTPEIDNNSPAHRMVQAFVEFANMEKVEPEAAGEPG